ncbi:DEAD/DEAH box helicase family protein [Chitinophaga sp. GbtcB8]|uniref:DEAD/DEAH box helicase family protein n=1 Tax=Chitinophaga sp. GbtcB8 TaxID=2824753 RepID=UPI001C30981C|nr:DEAD/DEAH box helicase family protein [Chitinophaga sp. GbtcB8]
MESNFSFLQNEFQLMYATARRAEEQVYTDPMYCAILCRKSLEEFVKWLYDNDSELAIPADTTLNSLMYEQSFMDVVPETLWRNINLVRKIGNNAAHGSAATTVKDSLVALKMIHSFCLWVVRIYSISLTPVVIFDENILPKGDAIVRTRKQAEHLALQYEAVKQQLERANTALLENKELAEKLQQRLDAIQAVKASHKTLPLPPLNVSEAETRRMYIDVMLKEAGWDITQPNFVEFRIAGMQTGDGRADYVLWGDDGKPLAVIEAKRTLGDAHEGQRQAELYADALERIYSQRPIIFYTNGFETNLWDDLFYAPRKVQGFYSKDELQLLVNRRITRKLLHTQRINKDIADRYYQEEAIKRVMERLEDKKARGTLLVMATGSGKTRIAAAITDLLTKANWAKRILFLADRNALVTQAKNAFNTYLPQLTAIDLTREEEDTASRIVFSTYPTMMNKIDNAKAEGKRYYGVGHFDVIIIDEAHRSIYKRYKAIFQYFDAIFIGLTATPKADADKDTYEQFGLEVHQPTYAYELDKAVSDGYLVPPKGIKVPLKFVRKGIRYDELSEAEKEAYEKEFLETYGEVPQEVDSSAVNTWLFNKDTVNKVLQTLMQKGLTIQGGDRLGKTIIFAKNHEHAVFIEKCFNELYPEEKGKMLRLIDNTVYDAQDMIYQFANPENTDFQIAVSVDMLDTGIDIPEILNLVFFKLVQSKAKYWQMIGRGTRLCPGIFGPGQNKECFYVFDICGNIEFFNSGIKESETGVRIPMSELIFKKKLNIAFLLTQHPAAEEEAIFCEQLLDELYAIVCSFNPEDFRVRMELRYVEKYKNRDRWNALDLSDVYEIENHLAHLYTDSTSTESARRFDLLMLSLIAQQIEQSSRIRYYQGKIKDTVKGLLRKLSIPQVKQQEPLIRMLQEEPYWKNSGVTSHNETRLALRNLIQYIDVEGQKLLYTNFTDTLDNIEEVELLTQYQELGDHKRRVEKIIRDNYDHITIHRIRNNQPITKSELQELERLLFSIDKGGNKEMLEKAMDGKPLGKFVRSILGLEINAAKEAFAEFLDKGNFSAQQINFINTIIDYLSVKGTIDKQMLFDQPFTDFSDQGLSGVFDLTQGAKIISIVDGINNNAIEAG